MLSTKYTVRKLEENDINQIYEVTSNNPLYYQYCPPFVTKSSILEDMVALPPKKTMEDKFYLGFFDGKKLVAIMDLILKYPNDETAFVGFFMMNPLYQGKGEGTFIIQECCLILKQYFQYLRLGYVKGNPQSEAFGLKMDLKKQELK